MKNEYSRTPGKKILKDYGVPVSNGIVILSIDQISKEISKLKSKKFVLKAQIHAGGRGKAGGVKLIKNTVELEKKQKNDGKSAYNSSNRARGKRS